MTEYRIRRGDYNKLPTEHHLSMARRNIEMLRAQKAEREAAEAALAPTPLAVPLGTLATPQGRKAA